MTVEQFERQVQQSAGHATELLEQIERNKTDEEALCPLLLQYVRVKFLLPEDGEETDVLLELAQHSVEHIAQLKKGGLKFVDISGTCASSSAVVKKVLLIMSLQKALHITFDKHEAADITTVSELVHRIAVHCSGADA